ncbi:hypothetical protein CBS101457_005846 [Exobasidium rhododendri]|nr:hypothetical protein CBS101457_005846 [Exobasidium rhododendri]
MSEGQGPGKSRHGRRDQVDDPLQRQYSPSPLREPSSPTRNFASSPNVAFLATNTPSRSSSRSRQIPESPSASSSSSKRSAQPLIHLNDEEEEQDVFDNYGDINTNRYNDKMGVRDRNYGAVSEAREGGSQARSTERPNHISMPPAPYSRSLSAEDAVSETSMLSPSTRSPALGGNRPRRISFKKRNLASGSQGGEGRLGRNLLHRASLGAFGQSSAGLNASPSGSADDRARARQLRQVQTMSVHHGDGNGPTENASSWERKPHIPQILPTAQVSPYSTPIPTVPFVVLCLVCFGEFSSAGVAGPFLFFQIESFNVGGEAEVAKWAGIVSAVFFFAQFLTSLLWSSVAQKHGRRSVLLVSLIGNCASLVLFGMATNLKMAISIRLAQGLFNGAVGVAKGAVRDLTDDTNEGRAMAQLGFAWGMGGIVGPLLGGVLCNPVEKFPWLFGDSVRFKEYPYLLPCLVVASFTAIGAFLSLFIGPDGGPRNGAIALPEKLDEERFTGRNAASNMDSFGRSAGKRVSGYFGSSAEEAGASGVSLVRTNNDEAGKNSKHNDMFRTFTQQVDAETGGPPSPAPSDDGTIITNNRAGQSAFDARSVMSRTRARHQNVLEGGSAYGYRDVAPGPAGTSHIRGGSRDSMHRNHRSNGGGGRRQSTISQSQYAPDFEDLNPNNQRLSFAQRFLLANDDAVNNLSDLWVAAAINGDEEYEDENDDFGYDYQDGEDEIDEEDEEAQETLDDSIEGSELNESTGSRVFGYDDADEDSLLVPRHLPPLNFARKNRLTSMGASSNASRPFIHRRGSGGNRIPSLYNNTGMESNILLSPSLSAGGPLATSNRQDGGQTGGYDPTLAGIPESGSAHAINNAMMDSGVNAAGAAHSSNSLFLQLPLVFIAHYGLVSLHSSTFDQIFMVFLVSPVASGGLGLTAAHYAELIAAMAFCQIGFQFYFYPKVGPPQGKLSHLAMMRLGTSLYLCYILFAFLRAFLHPSTDILVMTFMILFASIRWLANVCAYTSVSVLMNATTPPHLIALANGLAQTTSSAARFVGPLIGGVLWASAGSTGFWVVGITGFGGFLCSLFIR